VNQQPAAEERPLLRIESDPAMDSALSALRLSAVEPEAPSEARLEIGVIRSWRIQRDIRSWRWWMPSLCAAAAAAAAMLAILHFTSDPLEDQGAPASLQTEWPRFSESGD
jgi:hypothetical protein